MLGIHLVSREARIWGDWKKVVGTSAGVLSMFDLHNDAEARQAGDVDLHQSK
jgi:hypothetical protein